MAIRKYQSYIVILQVLIVGVSLAQNRLPFGFATRPKPDDSDSNTVSMQLAPKLGISFSSSIKDQIIINPVKQELCQQATCFILSCISNHPIQWKIQDAIEHPTGQHMKVVTRFITPEKNKPSKVNVPYYESELTIKNLKAEFSGWYICESFKNFRNPNISSTLEKKIYVYVTQDEASTCLIESTKVKVVEAQTSSKLVIPCRPDHPSRNLYLFQKGVEISNSTVFSENVHYDPTLGFVLEVKTALPQYGLLFDCRCLPARRNSGNYLIVRVLPKTGRQRFMPSSPFVTASLNDRLEISCFKEGIKTGIIPLRNLNMPRNAISRVISAEHAGIYSCIQIQNENDFPNSFNEADILYNWIVYVTAEKLNITLKMTNYKTVMCDPQSPKVQTEVTFCPCVTDDECESIQVKVEESGQDKECDSLRKHCNTAIPEERLFKCEYSKASCKLAEIKHSGLIRCSGRVETDEGKTLCQEKFIEVVGNIENPSSVGKLVNKSNGDCAAVGGSENTLGWIWMSGSCRILANNLDTQTLDCFAHRKYYASGVEWLYSDEDNPDLLFPIISGETDRKNRIRFVIQENSQNEEIVQSTLFIGILKSFEGKISCLVKHVNDSNLDEVSLPLEVKDIEYPTFVTSIDSNYQKLQFKQNTMNILDCSVNSFPASTISWYKQNQTTNAWVNLRTILNDQKQSKTIEFRNIQIDNNQQVLIFESFTKDQEGIYKCEVQLVLSTNAGMDERQKIERTFDVKTVLPPTTILIIVVVVLVLLALVAGFLAFFYRQRFRVAKNRVQILSEREIYDFVNGNTNAINPELDIAEQAHLLPYNRSYEFPKERLKFDKQLGAGAFGTVMKAFASGLLQNEEVSTVAVKTVQPNADILYFKALLTELKIMIHIGYHCNVVSLLGAVTDSLANREVYLLVEYCRYGNLQHYLHKHRKTFINQLKNGEVDSTVLFNEIAYANVSLDPREGQVNIDRESSSASYTNSAGTSFPDSFGNQPLWRNNVQGDYMDLERDPLKTVNLISWAFQVANGMNYLAHKKVIHGDLAARNVLVADHGVVKVSDFGLARQVYKDAEYIKTQKCPLPVKWMALESLRALQFSSKSDVWAFGIVLYEMFSLGDSPYPGILVDEDFLRRLEDGYRMKQPRFAPDNIYQIMLECWRKEPEDRPDFQKLFQCFGNMVSHLDPITYNILNQLFSDGKGAIKKFEETDVGNNVPVYLNTME